LQVFKISAHVEESLCELEAHVYNFAGEVTLSVGYSYCRLMREVSDRVLERNEDPRYLYLESGYSSGLLAVRGLLCKPLFEELRFKLRYLRETLQPMKLKHCAYLYFMEKQGSLI
jgi:hypothetical protein